MKRIITLLAVAALALAGCDSRATRCKDYQGDTAAIDPYKGEVEVTGAMMGFWTTLARVPLHNPTGKTWQATVTCTFSVDGFVDEDNPGTHVVDVCPASTVFVEIQYGSPDPPEQEYGATCDVEWF